MLLKRFKFKTTFFQSSLILLPVIFGFLFFRDWVKYIQLNQKTYIKILNWDVLSKGSSNFALQAKYLFQYEEKNYYGATTFSPPYHLNKSSAEEQIKKFSQKTWIGWFYDKNPRLNSLEKRFPYKRFFYFIIVIAVSIYGWAVYLRWNLFSRDSIKAVE